MKDQTFEKWWQEFRECFYDPGGIQPKVSWFNDHKELADVAFCKGVEIGMARSRNYTANSVVDPDRIHFANGRVVKLCRESGRLYLAVQEGERR